MKKTLVVFKKEFRDIMKIQTVLTFVAIVCAIFVPFFLSMRSGVASLIEQGSAWGEIRSMLENQTGMMLWVTSLMVLMLFPVLFGFGSVVQEKTTRVMESLLATPLGVKSLWWGKSLGAFLPGFIVNVVITVIIAAALNFLIIEPATGYFVLPPATLVTCLVILPLLVLPLVLILMLLTLIRAKITIASWINMLLIIGLILGLPRIGIPYTSWNFAWIHLGIAALLGVVPFSLTRLLTKEKVVLSSKG
jgi:ABC-type transport system involved in multi-copper enzyme maturation permease subunit